MDINEIKEDECLMCNNDLYLNPSMKLLSGPCGHYYCESCVSITFKTKVELVCKACNLSIRKQNFTMVSDDSGLEKENRIRKRVLDIFNKRRDDFPSLIEFNNYLETTEDIIFEMLDQNTVKLAEEKLKEYQRLNQTSISTNKVKKKQEEADIAFKVSEEQRIQSEKRNRFLLQDQAEQHAKIVESKKAMDDLAKGKITAQELKELDKKKLLEKQQKNNPKITIKLNDTDSLKSNDNNNDTNQTQKPNVNSMQYQPQAKPEQKNLNNNNNQPQQAQSMINLPQPLSSFKYDDLALKNLLPTTKQAEVAGFKQIYIKKRAFEESFDYLLSLNY